MEIEKIFDIIIYESNNFVVSQDWEIPIPGFFVIGAKRKINSIMDFTEKESREFIDLLVKVRKGMNDVLGINEVYLFQNEDSEHNFHLWIFPRLRWMDKFGRKIESVRLIMDYAKENMINEQVINEVKEVASKMKEYMGEN